MSDLQIGLLVIGAAAVAGVLIYNRVQERATRRKAEQAFASRHADVLLEESATRREPTFEPPAQAAIEVPPVDPRVDYVVEIQGAPEAALRTEWSALARQFRGTLAPMEIAPGVVRAGIQMVSRNGVVSEADLAQFRARVETLAAAHGASVSAPPMREALAGAQALDRTCADVDVQIALHVLGAADARLQSAAFSVAQRPDGVTLLLDVPRTPEVAKSYAAMARAARGLGGRVVDDNGNALDERALSAIGVEVEALGARLSQIGIEPGSPLAQRLFS